MVELLVVIAIIAMLAGMGMAALYASQQSARAAHTRALITKLNQALTPRYESYRTRRLPLQIMTGEDLRVYQFRQLRARRELMLMELPMFYSEILTPPTYLIDRNGNPITPSLTRAYRNRIASFVPGTSPNDLPALADIVDQRNLGQENITAEWLYMILTTSMGDESAGDLVFSPRDVADTDGDGMPEFVDGWGTPIEWIRWPAGFISDLQPLRPDETDPTNPAKFARNPLRDPDPFDPAGLDATAFGDTPARGFALYPLIVSAGPDGGGTSGDARADALGIFFVPTGGASADPYSTPLDSKGVARQRGELIPADYRITGAGPDDNIHNHMLDLRK